MKFLADEDVYELTIKFLREHGYEVIKVRDIGLQGSSDLTILNYAQEHNLILITRDKGFGSLVFLSQREEACVVLLRLTPSSLEKVHSELLKVLTLHPDKFIPGCFFVIEPDRHRIRRKIEK